MLPRKFPSFFNMSHDKIPKHSHILVHMYVWMHAYIAAWFQTLTAQ